MKKSSGLSSISVSIELIIKSNINYQSFFLFGFFFLLAFKHAALKLVDQHDENLVLNDQDSLELRVEKPEKENSLKISWTIHLLWPYCTVGGKITEF